jgi:ABC-type sugar transport system permease subunit
MTSIRFRELSSSYLFLLPALLFLLSFYIIPTLMALYISFTEYSVLEPPVWNGGINYFAIFRNPVFFKSLVNTGVYSIIFIPGKIVLAFIVSLALVHPDMRHGGNFLIAYYIPRMTSMVVASFIWMWLYQPDNGLLNSVLRTLSLPPQKWIFATRSVLPSVALVTIWKDFGYTAVLLVAGLQGIPAQMYEASLIDGANRWQIFWRITFPLLKPVTLLVVIRTFIESFRVFTQIFVMTKGGPANASTTIVHQIYLTGFEYLRLGQASSMSFVLLIILMLAFVPYFRMLRTEAGLYGT